MNRVLLKILLKYSKSIHKSNLGLFLSQGRGGVSGDKNNVRIWDKCENLGRSLTGDIIGKLELYIKLKISLLCVWYLQMKI